MKYVSGDYEFEKRSIFLITYDLQPSPGIAIMKREENDTNKSQDTEFDRCRKRNEPVLSSEKTDEEAPSSVTSPDVCREVTTVTANLHGEDPSRSPGGRRIIRPRFECVPNRAEEKIGLIPSTIWPDQLVRYSRSSRLEFPRESTQASRETLRRRLIQTIDKALRIINDDTDDELLLEDQIN